MNEKINITDWIRQVQEKCEKSALMQATSNSTIFPTHSPTQPSNTKKRTRRIIPQPNTFHFSNIDPTFPLSQPRKRQQTKVQNEAHNILEKAKTRAEELLLMKLKDLEVLEEHINTKKHTHNRASKLKEEALIQREVKKLQNKRKKKQEKEKEKDINEIQKVQLEIDDELNRPSPPDSVQSPPNKIQEYESILQLKIAEVEDLKQKVTSLMNVKTTPTNDDPASPCTSTSDIISPALTTTIEHDLKKIQQEIKEDGEEERQLQLQLQAEQEKERLYQLELQKKEEEEKLQHLKEKKELMKTRIATYKTLKLCFHAWFDQMMYTRQKNHTILDLISYKNKQRYFTLWRRYIVNNQIQRDIDRNKELLQQEERKWTLAVKHSYQTTLSKHFLFWLCSVKQHQEERVLQHIYHARKDKMLRVIGNLKEKKEQEDKNREDEEKAKEITPVLPALPKRSENHENEKKIILLEQEKQKLEKNIQREKEQFEKEKKRTENLLNREREKMERERNHLFQAKKRELEFLAKTKNREIESVRQIKEREISHLKHSLTAQAQRADKAKVLLKKTNLLEVPAPTISAPTTTTTMDKRTIERKEKMEAIQKQKDEEKKHLQHEEDEKLNFFEKIESLQLRKKKYERSQSIFKREEKQRKEIISRKQEEVVDLFIRYRLFATTLSNWLLFVDTRKNSLLIAGQRFRFHIQVRYFSKWRHYVTHRLEKRQQKSAEEHRLALLRSIFSYFVQEFIHQPRQRASEATKTYATTLQRRLFATWVTYTDKQRQKQLLIEIEEESRAEKHAQRSILFHYFRAWHQTLVEEKRTKEKDIRMNSLRNKTQTWLKEHRQIRSRDVSSS